MKFFEAERAEMSWSENCDKCGKFVSMSAPGVSWSQNWSHDMSGFPELHDTKYRCAKCTEERGIGFSNCANPENYRGINPAAPGKGAT